ncbi:hypothetical protein [Spongiimicrobium sp. 3-5]|uniref:hypothetical protein n=1 Tax=Spongiimicrobium sp. 3-5 TaxID=3332596 RepID=UPI00398120CC
MKKLVYNTLFLLGYGLTHAQIGIGTTTPNPDAALEIAAVDKGLLLPRVALTGTNNASPLSAHVEGMVVYNTTNSSNLDPGYYFNDGSKWVKLAIDSGNRVISNLIDNGNGTVTYTDGTGTQNVVTITALSENVFIQDGTVDINGDGMPNNNVTLQNFIDSIGTVVKAQETNTTLTFNDATGELIYTNEKGDNAPVSIAAAEPWFGTDDNLGATSNTENIYTLGNVAIGETKPLATATLSLGSGTSWSNLDKIHLWNNGVNAFGLGTSHGQMNIYTGDWAHDRIAFGYRDPSGNFHESMRLKTVTGQLGIGVGDPKEKLEVAGNIKASGNLQSGTKVYPDYVFENYLEGESTLNKDYTFKSLDQVERFIKTNKHLPGVTGISQLQKTENGYNINMTALSVQTLEKVEELYLHTIEQQKLHQQKDTLIKELQDRLSQLELAMASLKLNHQNNGKDEKTNL